MIRAEIGRLARVGFSPAAVDPKKKLLVSEQLLAIYRYWDILDNGNVYCAWSSFSLLYFVSNFVVLTNTAIQSCNVYEQVSTSVFWGDESETFGLVEKFDGSFVHFK